MHITVIKEDISMLRALNTTALWTTLLDYWIIFIGLFLYWIILDYFYTGLD